MMSGVSPNDLTVINVVMILCFMIPGCILWYRIYSYVCLYCVVSIIFIRVRFMQSPCMSSVVRFYCMPACAPGLNVPCKAVINRTTAKVPLARVVWNLLAAAEFSARTIWKATVSWCHTDRFNIIYNIRVEHQIYEKYNLIRDFERWI